MPRFFFDFYQADDFTADAVGIELADAEEAYLEAFKAAQEMWSELLKERSDPRRCHFEVRSEAGDVLFLLPFQEVLDCCVEHRPISPPRGLLKVSGPTREYARRVTRELKKEIENSRRILAQSHNLLATAADVREGQ